MELSKSSVFLFTLPLAVTLRDGTLLEFRPVTLLEVRAVALFEVMVVMFSKLWYSFLQLGNRSGLWVVGSVAGHEYNDASLSASPRVYRNKT